MMRAVQAGTSRSLCNGFASLAGSPASVGANHRLLREKRREKIFTP
jgi:hypothetical protein